MVDNVLKQVIPGDNIQTAVSVAKECGILSARETVIDVTVVTIENKMQPEIYFNAQELTPKLVILFNGKNIIIALLLLL